MMPHGRPNQRWSLAFVSDSLTCSPRGRIACVVEDYAGMPGTGGLVADRSLSASGSPRRLTRLIGIHMAIRGLSANPRKKASNLGRSTTCGTDYEGDSGRPFVHAGWRGSAHRHRQMLPDRLISNRAIGKFR